jgi:hypothetical protein
MVHNILIVGHFDDIVAYLYIRSTGICECNVFEVHSTSKPLHLLSLL